jgi:hypothetical protein
VGDGNINYVYIVEGPSGGVVLKQGLPYIRIAHDWPLTQVGLVSSAVIHHDFKIDLASCSAAGFLPCPSAVQAPVLSQAAARTLAVHLVFQQKTAWWGLQPWPVAGPGYCIMHIECLRG